MRILSLVLTCFLATPAAAHDYTAGDLKIGHPVIYTPFAGARAVAGYMSIENTGEAADRLIGVRVEDYRAMIHESLEVDGVMKMEHREGVDLPSGDTVSLAPGGLHIMIMGTTPGALVAGFEIDAMLIFEVAGEMPITFVVEDRPAEGADHSGH